MNQTEIYLVKRVPRNPHLVSGDYCRALAIRASKNPAQSVKGYLALRHSDIGIIRIFTGRAGPANLVHRVVRVVKRKLKDRLLGDDFYLASETEIMALLGRAWKNNSTLSRIAPLK